MNATIKKLKKNNKNNKLLNINDLFMEIINVLHLSVKLWTIIFDCLDLKTQIRFTQTCKKVKDNIFITDLCNILWEKRYKLNGEIVKKYPNITRLDAMGDCGIGDDDLIGLNLVELNAHNNEKIKNINHMTNLRILDASCECGIDDNSLIGLNLYKLCTECNPKIKK